MKLRGFRPVLAPVEIKPVPTKRPPCAFIACITAYTVNGLLDKKCGPPIKGEQEIWPPMEVFLDLRRYTNTMIVLPEQTDGVKYPTEKH